MDLLVATTTIHVNQGLQTWQIIVYPAITLLLAGATVAVALLPFMSKRRKARQLVELRQAATQNAVLGLPADPDAGRPEPLIGLNVIVPNLVKAVGDFKNGDTLASVMNSVVVEQGKVAQELVDHRTQVSEKLAEDHRDIQILLDQHVASDSTNFAAISETLTELHASLEHRVTKDTQGRITGSIEAAPKKKKKKKAKAKRKRPVSP